MSDQFWTTASETCIVSSPMATSPSEGDEVTNGDIRQLLSEV
jgi:hypothetical protein